MQKNYRKTQCPRHKDDSGFMILPRRNTRRNHLSRKGTPACLPKTHDARPCCNSRQDTGLMRPGRNTIFFLKQNKKSTVDINCVDLPPQFTERPQRAEEDM